MIQSLFKRMRAHFAVGVKESEYCDMILTLTETLSLNSQ